MVGVVIISHSRKVAEGTKEIALQMAKDAPIAAAGGTKDNELGTDLDSIISAINQVYSQDGVILLFDLGSSCMNASIAIEMLPAEIQENVKLIDAALVEGAIVAAVESSAGRSLFEMEESMKELCLHKMP